MYIFGESYEEHCCCKAVMHGPHGHDMVLGTISRSFPTDRMEPPHPRVRFVEDADLWRWALKDSREFHSGMIGLGLEFDVNKNPTIFETLQVTMAPSSHASPFTLPSEVPISPPQSLSISDIVESGRCLRAEEDRCISKAMGSAFRVQLGGDQGRAKGLGVCLAVMVEDGMEKIRSRMGNELAMESRSQGLQVDRGGQHPDPSKHRY